MSLLSGKTTEISLIAENVPRLLKGGGTASSARENGKLRPEGEDYLFRRGVILRCLSLMSDIFSDYSIFFVFYEKFTLRKK